MKTIIITGNDTGVGKTKVAGYLARMFALEQLSVQYVKLVETGIADGVTGDVEYVTSEAAGMAVQGIRLFRYEAPLAPVTASQADGRLLFMKDIRSRLDGLSTGDVRLIEGAGGVSVPLDSSGDDIVEFAQQIKADFILIVVENRLGAINQGRLTHEYVKRTSIPSAIWLNERVAVSADVKRSNEVELNRCGITIVGRSDLEMKEVTRDDSFWR